MEEHNNRAAELRGDLGVLLKLRDDHDILQRWGYKNTDAPKTNFWRGPPGTPAVPFPEGR